MSLREDFFSGARGRYERFKPLFEAQDQLGEAINGVLDNHALTLREGEERDLSLFVVTSLVKGMKTSEAITRLCLLGYGESAIILLRSSINLLINTAYVLAEQSVERLKDFLACSYEERVKYLRLAHGERVAPWSPPVPRDEVEGRAKRWKRVSIEQRARVFGPFHYEQGYRLYSSIEHSDAWALSAQVEDWNEIGPTIGSEESDRYVDMALIHNFGVVADLFFVWGRFFGVDRPEVFDKVRRVWVDLGSTKPA